MRSPGRLTAAAQILLLLPATLFMAALGIRSIPPAPLQSRHAASLLIDWFSGRPVLGLNVFLMAMPFAAFVIGGAGIVRSWTSDAELRQAARESLRILRTRSASIIIAIATLTAAGILAIVALHVLAN